ncbi:T9SS type B sorting domain-containing protein [Flavobacterium zepuense]|uniref:T9SS type B sorting domain-containing protein n=1 Tax=Flavobacterium zepuense TaxID=2593302 RepID=A0A552V1F3_9FLAO|nr:gliding motility-associated C-terminal domain-containing protein [Flavobacterium zepuense]TRW24285.1 T9SS type B sorting domain-containing protein [Flavobacterium zepuense]
MKKFTFLIFMAFISYCGHAQLAPPEGFEGTWTSFTGFSGGGAGGPAGWAIINDAGPTVTWIQGNGGTAQPAFAGTHSAFLNNENVLDGTTTSDWLVSTAFTVPTAPRLRFQSRLFFNADQGTTFKVMISTTTGTLTDQINTANFVELQNYTETTLNPTQQAWTEKTITLPDSYIGEEVYVAFVMMGDAGERWAIDNVMVVQDCVGPTAASLGASNIGLTSATLTWGNPGNVTNWEIEVLPQASTPTGVGVPYTGAASYVATQTATGAPLTADTCYKYYVRAACATYNTSAWVGPFNFCTVALGESCAAPIVVGALPYTTTNDTNNFSDNPAIEGSPGATGCGTTSSYLGGNDVVYAYTPTTTGIITITMSPTATWSGVFVYDDCADIGVSCIGGVGSSDTSIRTIPNLSVTAGTTYYIVISTWPSPQTTGYTLTIQQVNCLPPVGQPTTGVGPTTATLNWTNPGNATSWQYVLQAPGTGLPTGAGTTATVNALPLTTLTSATAYEYYVRADCGDGTFSVWAGPYTFMTTQVPAVLTNTVPYTQDFEGTHGWSLSNGTQTNKWFVGTATSNSPTHSLYISNDNGVSNAYTITTASTVHAYRDIQVAAIDQLLLSFDWKNAGETNDNVRVWVVPSTFVPTAGTGITAAADRIQIGNTYFNNANWSTQISTIFGSAFSNSIMRVVFEWRNNTFTGTQPPAAIDNINLSVVPCPQPTNVAASNPTQNSGTFTWVSPTSTTPTFDYYISTSNTVPAVTTVPTGNQAGVTFTDTTLSPSTTYYFWVRSNCGDGTSMWVGPAVLQTTQVPAPLNFTENWENNGAGWTIANGTQTNQWFVGTATSNSPTHSLYVSNDGGATNSYNVTALSTVHAYRDITIPAGAVSVNVGFDWKNVGESGWDYISVWSVPTSYVPTPGTLITATNGNILIPGTGNLTNNALWTTFNGIIDVSAYQNTTRRIVFQWRSDTSFGTQPPGAVDNINISLVTCPQPITLTATATDEVATLNWVPTGTETAWEVYVVPTGQPAPTAATVGVDADVHPFEVDVNSSTTYQYYVRAVCSEEDKSLWSGPVSFTTAIGNNECTGATTLTVNPTDACAVTTQVLFTGATSSTSGTLCANTVNGADVWYQFTATEQYHSIALSNFTGTAQPIVLSIYDGTVCTELGDPIYCSLNNVVNATGLIPGNVYTVRVTIAQASPSLTTGFNLCVNTPQLNGGPNPNQCQIVTVNAGFELPDISGPYPPLISDYTIPGWRTTATDHMIEVWPDPNFENIPAYEGAQFIELNANQVSGVYQDYNTPAEGTVFTYSFAHRARTITSQPATDVVQLKAGPPAGPFVNVGDPVSSTNSAWTFNTGTYTVPADQPVTRFIFQAVTSGNGNPTVGNFLDAISFVANNGVIAFQEDVDCDDNIAEVEASGGGEWSADSANPSVTTFADPTNNTTTISGFTVTGDYNYTWTTEFCSADITIHYNGGGIATPVVQDITYCEGDAAAPLTATILPGNTINWYTAATGGAPLGYTPTPDTSVAGIYTFYVSQTQVNCESPRQPIVVTVNALPTAPVAVDVDYCQDAVATPLTATADTGNTLNWYTVANGGTALAGAPTPVTTATGTTVYYVSQQTALGCESDRTAVTVTVNPTITPVTAFTLPSTICAADVNPTPVPATGYTSGGTYTATPSGLVIDPSTGTIDLALSTPNTYTVTYTINADTATCNVGNASSSPITITPVATPVTAFSYTNACALSANQLPALGTGFTTGGTFTSDNAGLDINAATGEINMATSAPGNYTVTYTFNADIVNCIAAAGNTATIAISAATVPVTEFAYNELYCFGSANPVPSFAANFTNGGTFTATNGLVINPTTGEVNIAQSAAGIYTVTYTVAEDASTCNTGGTFTDVFTIGSEFAYTIEGNCVDNSYILSVLFDDETFDDSAVTYQWTTLEGTPVGTDSPEFNATQYINATTATETFPVTFVLTVNNGGCNSAVPFEVKSIACTIQKGISPNNDGKNDSFDLTSLGVNKLSIFNRYGKEVYVKSNYASEWYGQTNGGDELPTGTYYYVIERTGESITGWIYINRQDN